MNNEMKFKVSTKDIIKYLGAENYETKESAVYELIKNSYDAEAKEVIITLNEDKIEIKDDGVGMSLEIIEQNWMQIGGSSKKDIYQKKDRILTGEKGIGRLALAKLGETCKMHTYDGKTQAIEWVTDWTTTKYSKIENKIKGTTLIIEKLNENWSEKDVNSLKYFLSSTIRYDMSIKIIYKKKTEEIKNIFKYLQENINYFLNFNFSIAKNDLSIHINNKFFSEDIVKELNLNEQEKISIPLNDDLTALQGVSGEFFYGFRITKDNKAQFFYKPDINQYNQFELYGKKTEGVILYRNGFSVQGFDGTKDWLSLSTRYSKRNKAVSDFSGASGFRKNNLFGYINIDKIKNKELKDLSNRQGIIDNDEYKKFCEIIYKVLEKVEDYFKFENIKKISNYTDKTIEDDEYKKEIVKLKKELKDYEQKTFDEKKKSLKSKKKEKYLLFNLYTKLEKENQNFKNDSFFLQVHATQSLMINSQTHDLKNALTTIKTHPKAIENILKTSNMHDRLVRNTKDENTLYNYGKLIEQLKNDGINLNKYFSRYLNGIKKDKLELSEIQIKKYMSELSRFYTETNKFIEIKYTVNFEIINFYESSLDIILNNLIDNSMKYNLGKKIKVKINLKLLDNDLEIDYTDDGVGLDEKYRNNEEKILLLHETSSSNGTGLGMWIINKRVNIHNGSIEIMKTNKLKGFEIVLKLKRSKK